MARNSGLRFAHVLALLLGAYAPVHAEAPSPSLEQLRANFQQAQQGPQAIRQPESNDPDFQQKLPAWANADRQYRQAGRALITALIQRWGSLPVDAPEAAEVHDELKELYQKIVGTEATFASYNERSFIADALWPQLASVTPERAQQIVEMTQPHDGVRQLDQDAEAGKPTEPYGWNIQDTYAMALLRAGREDEARRENELLLKKLTNNLQKGGAPKAKVNHRGRNRTRQSLRREFLLHRALIEALDGQQEQATQRLQEAQEIQEEEPIAAQQAPLIREIQSHLKP